MPSRCSTRSRLSERWTLGGRRRRRPQALSPPWFPWAAATVGAFDLAEGLAAASVAGLREQGRLGALAQALVLRAWSEIHIGRWDVALPDAEEADRLAQETGQPIWGGAAKVALSILAGLRAEEEEAEALAVRAERVGLQFGARAVLSVVQLARGLTALGAGGHDDAYAQLRRMFNPSDPAYHRMESCWAIGNLAEAAVHSGHRDDAREGEVMAELERLAERTAVSLAPGCDAPRAGAPR
jgi:hypothetical protein